MKMSCHVCRTAQDQMLMNKEKIAVSPDVDTTSEHFGEITGHDADDLIRAQQAADKLSAELGEPLEPRWFLKTKWLQQLQSTHRARGDYALGWRPRFLAALSLSCSYVVACRAAKINYRTYRLHSERDPDFKEQCQEAQERAIDMLHAACWRSALEGDLEPVFWQGKQVGQLRKVDNRLRIEMLRAHMPKTFKTPGSKIAISAGNVQNNNLMVFDEETREQLIALRQEALTRMAEKRAALPAIEA